MDVVREHLMYKNNPLEICMKKLTSQEQYEFVRIVLESKTETIFVCKHASTNFYIDTLLAKLNIQLKQCSEDSLLEFGRK
jgi:hypothetical protein